MTDAFDLSHAQIVNAPDVRAWPITTAITRVEFSPTNTRLTFSKQDGPDRWPDQPWGQAGDSLQYTIWLFLKIGDQWVGSAFVEMWHGRDGVGDAPSDYARNWYYASRWDPMPSHGAITPGELIGFMVTPGNGRDGSGPLMLQERSNIVIVPASDQAVVAFDAPAPLPVDPLPPVPDPPPVPSALDAAVATILAQQQQDTAAILAAIDKLRADAAAVLKQIGAEILPKILGGHA